MATNTLSPPPAFEEVEHTADWALRVYGRTLDELLVNAAVGMNTLLTGNVAAIPRRVKRRFVIDGDDAESLLVNWLSELVYWAETEQLLFGQFDLGEVTFTHLCAVVRGGHVAELQKHIKAVTYHNLRIEPCAQGLVATVVFDV